MVSFANRGLTSVVPRGSRNGRHNLGDDVVGKVGNFTDRGLTSVVSGEGDNRRNDLGDDAVACMEMVVDDEEISFANRGTDQRRIPQKAWSQR
jgi:hypothetical protein